MISLWKLQLLEEDLNWDFEFSNVRVGRLFGVTSKKLASSTKTSGNFLWKSSKKLLNSLGISFLNIYTLGGSLEVACFYGLDRQRVS